MYIWQALAAVLEGEPGTGLRPGVPVALPAEPAHVVPAATALIFICIYIYIY